MSTGVGGYFWYQLPSVGEWVCREWLCAGGVGRYSRSMSRDGYPLTHPYGYGTWDTRDTVDKREVRILLECFLLVIVSSKFDLIRPSSRRGSLYFGVSVENRITASARKILPTAMSDNC